MGRTKIITKAQGNWSRTVAVLDGKATHGAIYRTRFCGTASGMMHSDVMSGTVCQPRGSWAAGYELEILMPPQSPYAHETAGYLHWSGAKGKWGVTLDLENGHAEFLGWREGIGDAVHAITGY